MPFITETFNTFDLHLLGPIVLWRLKQSAASVNACTVQQNIYDRPDKVLTGETGVQTLLNRHSRTHTVTK